MRGTEIWTQLDRSAKAASGALMLSRGRLKQTKIKVDFCVSRIDRKRTLITLGRLRRSSQSVKHIRHRHEGICEVRIDVARELIVVEGELVLADAAIQVS